jgi:hypothetical protein
MPEENSLEAWQEIIRSMGQGSEQEMTKSKEVEIELQDGEDLAAAIRRLAKQHAATQPEAKPTCGYKGDPLCDPPNCAGACPPDKPDTRPERSQSPKSGRAKKPSKKIVDPMLGDTSTEPVYSALHIYQREGESEGAVRINGNRERRMHGPGTLVFVHMHQYGSECTDVCKERV